MVIDEQSRSELRYRRLFEAARDGILIVDPETRKIIDVNPFMAEFLGFKKNEFIGKELFEIGLLKDSQASQEAFRELRASGYIRYDDLPLKAKDGHRVDVEFVSNLYQEGPLEVIQCNIRDISERKRADYALRQSEERFKLVARAVSDVVWDWDLLSNSLWWSDGFERVFGYTHKDIEPNILSWSDRIHPDDRRAVLDGIQESIKGESDSWRAEYRFQYKNGPFASVQDCGFILRDGSGLGVRMVGGMRDLTFQKKMEMQFLRAQRMESIGTLAGGIAHDLNNVLTPIMMAIDLLRLELRSEPNHIKILDTIQDSSRRGAELVRQVLSFARGLDGQRVCIHLRSQIGELRAIISETFPRDIRIATHISEEPWSIIGDPTQIHQVLLNLAVNARDAMPLGGILTISTANIKLDAQYVSSCDGAKIGSYVRIDVSDTGFGISQAVRDRIFEPFFTTKELGKGTGLGLATVQAIVKSHGGFITVDSEPDKGTNFGIYLPATPSIHTAEILVIADAAPPRGNNELILVADDEESIRKITRKTLETFGYRVITANDGVEEVATYVDKSKEIALVITDIMMPVMDGTAAVQIIKRMKADTKVIAVSGLKASDHMQKLHSAGVNDFLSKPYSAKALLLLVREVLDRAPANPAP